MPKQTNRETELLKFMDKVPPCLARVMSVIVTVGKKGERERLKPIRQITIDSGLNRRSVQRITMLGSWETVDVGDADKFLKGCGVNIFDEQAAIRFVKKYADDDFPHLTNCERARLYFLMGWR